MGESQSRRNLLLRAAALAAGLPRAALSQQPGDTYVLGILLPLFDTPKELKPLSPEATNILARHGFFEGKNLRADRVWTRNQGGS